MLTERDELLAELERLDVAGATLLTEDEELLLPDCDTLRVELEPDTLRLELEPATLRLELEPDTLRLELEEEADTLRLDEDAATLRLDEEPDTALSGLEFTDLEATLLLLTVRLALEPNAAVRLDTLPLRFLSHPPLLILRLGV